jgi:hypothetical protein
MKYPNDRKPRRTGKTVPEDINAVLGRILNDTKTGEALKNKQMADEYTRRIGKDFAKHMTVDKVFHGTLYCLVDSPSWLQQYQFYAAEILQRVNTPPLPEAIRGVRFSLGRMDDSEYLSGGERAAQRKREALPALSPGDIETLEKTVRAISPELQDSIRPLVDDWIACHRTQNEEKQDTP